MAAPRRRRDDDAEDFDLPPLRKKGGDKALLIGLAIGGAALLLLTCLGGAVIVAVIVLSPGGTQPDEYVGSWKGRFLLHGRQVDVVYTFEKSGTLREENFDLQGRREHASGGRWRFRNGRLEVDFSTGSREIADAFFVDNNTINYRIVSHTDRSQIGTGTTFRRQ